MPYPMRDFALEVYFSRSEFNVRYNMTGSDARNMPMAELLALASPEDRAAFDQLGLGYTQTFGHPELRAAISSTFDRIDIDHIVTFAGAEEAIYIAMKVLLSADDHAIVITPNYQAAETIPLSICPVTGVALDATAAWALDLDTVRAAILPNTKLISVNFPNNPTGALLPDSTWIELVQLCRERDIWLFSDEVYRLIERRPEQRLAQAADLYEKGISLNVMSKSYGLAGLRIGWLACPDREFLVRCERYKHFLSICNSAPSERLAIIALKARDTILAINRGIANENLALLEQFMTDYDDLFDWRTPDGGVIAFPRYTGSDGVEEFCRGMEEAGILFLPASIYRSELGPVPTDHFRIGFGKSNFAEGLAATRAVLQRNRY